MIWLHVFQMDMSPLAENALHLLFSLLRIPFWLLILRFTRKWLNPTRTHLSAQIWLMISVLCLSSFLGAITLIAQVSLYYRTFTIWPACAACILTNLGICRLCAFVSNKVREAAAADMLQAQQSYYEDLRREQKRVRELRHDMANHLSVAQSLITQEKVLQAQNYLSELSQEISSASPKEFCRMGDGQRPLKRKVPTRCRKANRLPHLPGASSKSRHRRSRALLTDRKYAGQRHRSMRQNSRRFPTQDSPQRTAIRQQFQLLHREQRFRRFKESRCTSLRQRKRSTARPRPFYRSRPGFPGRRYAFHLIG